MLLYFWDFLWTEVKFMLSQITKIFQLVGLNNKFINISFKW